VQNTPKWDALHLPLVAAFVTFLRRLPQHAVARAGTNGRLHSFSVHVGNHEEIVMRRLGIVLLLCAAAAPLSANEYSQQDVAACTPDAWRVCGYAIPDGDRVRQCLVDNQRNLSTPCWNVIERYRTAMRPAGAQPVSRSTTGQRTRE
jgi:hypothetical protein